MSDSIIVVGLGFGDEGKGSIVDFLAPSFEAVCRFNGGFQAAHNVVSPTGETHTFSHFGSGTFHGLPTYLLEDVIISPPAMDLEYKALEKYEPKLFIHESCLVATTFHRLANRIIDKINGHGSCGVGIGLTRQMWAETGDALTYYDLQSRSCLRRKLNWTKQWCQNQLVDYAGKKFAEKLTHSIYEEFDILFEGPKKFRPLPFDVPIGPKTIFEGAQGMCLDEVYGTIPHTTYSDTTPQKAVDICNHLGLPYKIIGVTRSFETRHGNGPMYNEDQECRFKDDANYENGAFAGRFRTGEIDFAKINKMADLANVDCLAVNHLDICNVDLRQFNKPVYIGGYGPAANHKKLI